MNIYPISSEVCTNRANAYKQSLEKSLGEKVIIDLAKCQDETQWFYCGYFFAH